MKKIFKMAAFSLVVLLILFQLYPRPTANHSTLAAPNDITVVHTIPADVQQVLLTSCYDCHSNNTVYPWYSNIQPVAIWLNDHIKEGKRELNFSEFGSYRIRRQYRKLEEIKEQVETNEMPLSSFTLIHRDAILNSTQKLALVKWVVALRDSFKGNYPLDSLQRKS